MIKWIYNDYFIRSNEKIFLIFCLVILLIILLTIFLVIKELKGDNNEPK